MESFPSGKLQVLCSLPDEKVVVTIGGCHHRKNLQELDAPGDFSYFMTIVLSFSDYSHGSVSMRFTISTFSHFHSLAAGSKVELTKHFQFSSSQVGKSDL